MECKISDGLSPHHHNSNSVSNISDQPFTPVAKNLNESVGSIRSQAQSEKTPLQKQQEGLQKNTSRGNEDGFANRLNTGASIQEINSESSDDSEEDSSSSSNEGNTIEFKRQASFRPEATDNNTSVGSNNKFLHGNNQISFEVPNSLHAMKNPDLDKIQEASQSATQRKSEPQSNEDSNAVLMQERQKLLHDVLKNLSKDQLEAAILKCKKLISVTNKIFYQSEKPDFTGVCADYLLFARCLIKSKRLQEARNELLHLKRFVIEHVSDVRYDYRKFKDSDRVTVRTMSTKKEFLNFATDDGITLTKKKAVLDMLKSRINIFSTLANLFYHIGDWNNCEDMYVKCAKITENNFGECSFEASNCYYLLGVFYLQHVTC